MPSSDKWEKWTLGCGVCGAIVLFLIGLDLTISGIIGYTKDDAQTVNNMIRADIGADAEVWKPTPEIFMLVFIIFGIVIMLASLCGCLGSATQREDLVCTYFFFTMTGGLCLLMIATINMGFTRSLEGVVERQATTYCDREMYPIFKAQLKCNSTAHLESSRRLLPNPCDEDCEERVALLQKMRGCETLFDMCHDYTFQSMGEGACTSGDATIDNFWFGQATSGSFDATDCQRICNEHVDCAGLMYIAKYDEQDFAPDDRVVPGISVCAILSTQAPTSTEAKAWFPHEGGSLPADFQIDGADGKKSVECFSKGDKEFLMWGRWFSKYVMYFCIFSSLVIFCITCSSCTFLFTLTTRRKGKKGGCAVCARMLCPCCIPRYERKFETYDAYEDSETSEEEYEE